MSLPTPEARMHDLSPRAASWSEPSSMEPLMHPQTSHNGESLTPDQINELLTSIDSVSGPASPPDSNYTYASVTSSAAPHVVLSPSWTLPRRADHNALASLQHYQANNPLPDMDTLNMSSGVHSPMLSAAEVSGMLSQSPPGSSFHPFMSSELSMPFSAPPESYEFDQTFMGQQHDFLNPHRQPSWPVSPPQSTPSPLPQVARAGTLPPEPLSAAGPSMFTRRRSISMSGMDLEAATMAVNNTTASSTGPVRPKPNRHRSASNLAHTRPPPASRPQQDSLYSLPRSPSAKERRAVASKRRATLQSVIADATLPSSGRGQSPVPPPPAQPAAHLQPSPQLSPHGPSDLCKALEAVELAQKYIEQQIGLHGDGDSGFVTSSHVHLLRDLKARLKARSEMV